MWTYHNLVSARDNVVRAFLPGAVGVQRASHVHRRTRRCGAPWVWVEILRCRRFRTLFGIYQQRKTQRTTGGFSQFDGWHRGGLPCAEREDSLRLDAYCRTFLRRADAFMGYSYGAPSDKAYPGVAYGWHEGIPRIHTAKETEAT